MRKKLTTRLHKIIGEIPMKVQRYLARTNFLLKTSLKTSLYVNDISSLNREVYFLKFMLTATRDKELIKVFPLNKIKLSTSYALLFKCSFLVFLLWKINSKKLYSESRNFSSCFLSFKDSKNF